MGFALPDAAIHAPNEKMHLPQLARGVATCVHLIGGIRSLRSLGAPAPPLAPVGEASLRSPRWRAGVQ
jgi:hypothetical protein